MWSLSLNLLVLCSVLSLGLASHARSHPANLRQVGSCLSREGVKTVWIIKQWRLPSTTITKGFREKYPQEKNQTAIYKALSESIKKKEIQLVLGTGCEGEINEDFETKFNGWDYASLKKISQTRSYPKILSHVPLKLEARYGEKTLTLCGDSEKLIEEGNIRLSNLRGWLGFWNRLTESQADPEKLKLYSETAASLLRVPKDTPAEKILSLIKENIRADLEGFQKSLADRNERFVKQVQEHDYKTAAIVVSGPHIDDLKEKLQAAGLNCQILEPPGYDKSDEKLIEEFQRALK
ncbi:MAG: hypothetical protein AB7G93_21180 [Bdellovibrionales bacterium]